MIVTNTHFSHIYMFTLRCIAQVSEFLQNYAPLWRQAKLQPEVFCS